MKYHKNLLLVTMITFLFLLFCCASVQKSEDKTVRLDSPRLAPVAESEWNDAQKKLLTPLKSYSKDGHVINVFTTLARHPKGYQSWMTFGMHILLTNTIPAREREILILRTGWLCQSKYEFGQHTLVGKQAGLTDDEVLRITKGPDASGWSAFDKALIRAADELHRDSFITDGTWNALSQSYDEKQLIDLIFTVGQYNLVCMALNSLGVQLDPGVPGFPEGAGS